MINFHIEVEQFYNDEGLGGFKIVPINFSHHIPHEILPEMKI